LKIGIGLFTGQIPKGMDRTYTEEYQEAVELVELAEEEGFDSAWVSEHHFSDDGYLPSLLPLLAAFAGATERMELGTGLVLAPFHDPIRLAEDFAVVDQLSGGRLICGLGIGWREEEFRQFGISVKSRPKRLEEITAILRLAWTEDRFDFSGRHYNYEGVRVMPKPARVPLILVGGFVDDAIRRAGRIGDGYISSRASAERVAQSFALAEEERAKAGLEGPPAAGLLINVWASADPERDWPMVRDGIGHQLGVYSGWRAGTDLPGIPLEVMPPDEETIRKTSAFGTPDEVVERLRPFAEALGRYPESHMVCRLHYPGMDFDQAAPGIEAFAREVIPRLREITG
jgi:alkanesulfonate monooxygenase SsuD/methylene tetrahydromethanopterin reductase-like flavin-dependent oxidoreductase (luciferase family)